MREFLTVRTADGLIEGVSFMESPDDGPIIPHHPLFDGVTYLEYAGFTRAGRRDSESAYWRDGAVEWIEMGVLADYQANAIAKTYADVDAVYEIAIGRRATEYARAEEAARAFLAASEAPAVVSDYIAGHAANNPTGEVQTSAWAAQQIIERADAFRWAELQMRNLRFARQRDMRAAATHEELAAAVALWEGFITWLRATLGL